MTEPTPFRLDLAAVAALLELPPETVSALVDRGYLAPAPDRGDGREFQLSDVKAFLARNADNGSGAGIFDQALRAAARTPAPSPVLAPIGRRGRDLEPEELLTLLDERAEQMAYRVFKLFATVFPEVDEWPRDMQGEFVIQAKGRFEAILTMTEKGLGADESLFDELRVIGHSAAQSGTPLPHLLVLLRLTRDLVVQNAVELSETGNRHGGHALSLLLTRILPAMDRLGDALAQGYWDAISGAT